MVKPIPVLYLANAGTIMGGGQISLLNLLQRLNREKIYPIVVCPSKGNFYDALKNKSIETIVTAIPSPRNLNIIKWLLTVLRIRKILRNKKIRLVHSNGSRPTIYGGIAARLAGVPLIWHVRIADQDPILDKLLVRLATEIAVISKAVEKRFDWYRNKQKIHLVYNGIDTKKFRPEKENGKLREELGINSSLSLIGSVGRLDWYKGYEYFLEAAKMVLNKIPTAQFVIVGDGEYKEKLISLAVSLQVNKNVHFLGNRSHVSDLLQEIDLFVISSVSEGFGRAAAEAMACALPVVSTTAGGLKEVVEDSVTGILVSPRDPSGLAAAIVTILENKEKALAMGSAGRRRVERLFSINQNVKCTEELYTSMLF